MPRRGRRRRRRSTCARFECLGACDIAPMASVDGVYVGPLDARRGARGDRGAARGPRGAARQAARRAARSPTRARTRPRPRPLRRRDGGRRGRSARPDRAAADAAEQMHDQLLFKDIDEPGLEHARRLRAPRRLRDRCARRWRCRATSSSPSSRPPACAAAAAPASRWARRPRSCPRATMDKYLVCNADESEPGTFKDRELMQKNPHMLIEGMIIAAYAAGANRSFIYIRGEYAAVRPTSSTPRSPRPRAGYVGENILGSDLAQLVVHRGAGAYICGEETGAARLARGQARQPAPEAAVPGQPGPLPGPDADQQRRDADDRPAHPAHGRRGVREDRRRELDRHEARLGLRQRAAPGQLRDRARHALARDHLRPRRRPARGPRGQVLVPRRLVLAGADRRTTSTSPTTSTRWRRPARCSAPARSSSSTTRTPIVDVALKLAKFYRHESCGKCTPCREGTNWTVKMLERIQSGAATPMDLDIMASVAGPDHRQLPVRARRRDGDADRLDDREVPRRVRGPHRGRARTRASATRAERPPRRRARRLDAAPRSTRDDHLLDRRPRGQGAREHDAGRRRQARRRRDPGLLLRAQARPAGRRVPHVPGRDRGHPEAADRAARRRSRTAWSSTRRPSA